ncbi:MAG: Fic family protein [Candidatus Eisenbacteria bacterium]|nr:Fic family protein [Candidatus Eisenbacteria bacterium]
MRTPDRTYLRTHPFISFRLNMAGAGPKLWILLGEAQSKCRHISGAPLLPAVQTTFRQVNLAKGVLATTAIEGNTLSEAEVRARLEGTLSLPPSKEYLGQEVDNIVRAINFVGREVLTGNAPSLTPELVKTYNRMILEGLPLDPEVRPGACRTYQVGVGRYRPVEAQDCEYLLERFCNWLNSDWSADVGELRDHGVVLGVLKAVAAHLYLAWIHPFGDGNGRTARLIEFQLLLSAQVPDVAAHLLSNHYNDTRAEYYLRLNESSRGEGDPLPFIRYAVQGFVDSLRQQIEVVRDQQLAVHWQNFIYDEIDGHTSAATRRRHLLLDLPADRHTPITQIARLTPRLAAAYARKTTKTVRRDVNWLIEVDLVREVGDSVVPRIERMAAFLPRTYDPISA